MPILIEHVKKSNEMIQSGRIIYSDLQPEQRKLLTTTTTTITTANNKNTLQKCVINHGVF